MMKNFYNILLLLTLLLSNVSSLANENCVNLPGNQSDFRSMVDFGLIEVSHGDNTTTGGATPTIPLNSATVDDYVFIRNQFEEIDPNISILKTVPDGFVSSMRIGHSTGAETNGTVTQMIAELNVDTKHPIININYAAVLVSGTGNKSDISSLDRRNFRLEFTFLDADNNTIDTRCFSFTASDNWRDPGSAYTRGLYIPWTSVSVDFTGLELSRIRKVRVWNLSKQSTSGHYSYAYVAMRCVRKEITRLPSYCREFNSIGSGTVTLYAPEGFRYSWYQGSVTFPAVMGTRTRDLVLTSSASGSYTVFYWTPGSDSSVCNNSLVFRVSDRYPIAQALISVNTNSVCGDQVVFTDRSYVATTITGVDGSGNSTRVTDNLNERCDEVFWEITRDIGGYSESFSTYEGDTTFTKFFTQPGAYTLTVTAKLSTCTHVQTYHFTVTTPKIPKSDTIYVNQCEGQYYNFNGQFIYNTGTYVQNLTAKDGCDSTLVLIYNKFITTHTYLYDTIHYYTDIDAYVSVKTELAIFASQIKANRYRIKYDEIVKYPSGCDSAVTLYLYVYPHKVDSTKITICDEKRPFMWHGNSYYNTTKVTKDSIHTHDTDFTWVLDLTVLPPITPDTIHDYFCDGQSKTFSGINVTNDTTISFRFSTINGCDSIVRYCFHNVHQPSFNNGYREICTGDSFPWTVKEGTSERTFYLKTPGRHEHRRPTTNPSIANCDTVDYITIRVLPIVESFQLIYVCPAPYDSVLLPQGEGLPYINRGPGDYDVILKSISTGCDSIIHYKVRARQISTYTTTVSMCQNDPITISGEVITASGEYRDTLLSSTGCFDSLVVYNVTIRPIAYDTSHIYLCRGDTNFIIRNGETISVAHTTMTEYNDTLYDQYGCDSIHTIYINSGVDFIREEIRTMCEGSTYSWRGKSCTTLGTYSDTVPSSTPNGCDTIYILKLKTAPVVSMPLRDTAICANDSIFIGGQWYSQANQIISQRVPSQYNCDSLINIRIRHKHTYSYLIEDTVCEGDSYIFNGRLISQQRGDSIYYEHYVSVEGCDSIFELHLHVQPSFDTLIYDTICNGSFYQFGDRYVHRTGIYTYDCISEKTGCDSMTTLSLTVMPNFVSETVKVVLCDDSAYLFIDTLITNPGIYTRTLPTKYGCDSTRIIRVERDHSFYRDDTVYICYGQRYNFLGKWYDTTGVYYDSALTLKGQCDSIHCLHLFVYPTYYNDTIHVQLCHGSTYNVKGHTIPVPNVYVDSNLTINGCDSTVTYIVTSGNEFLYEFPTYHLCEGDTYIWKTKWNDIPISTGGTYIDSILSGGTNIDDYSTSGCDSTFRINVHLEPIKRTYLTKTICHTDSIYFAKKMINKPGYYYDTLTTYPYLCDSIIQLHLLHYPHYFHADTASICANEFYNFNGRLVNQDSLYVDSFATVYHCDSVFVLRLNVRDTQIIHLNETICIDSAIHFGDTILSTTGTYSYTTKNRLFCDSTTILNLTVMPKPVTYELVYICQGTAHVNRYYNKSFNAFLPDTTFKTPGVYQRHFVSQFGCDSTHIIDVRVVYPYHHYDTVHICYGEEYTYQHRTFSLHHGYDAPSVIDTTFNPKTFHASCDSAYHLHLVIDPIYNDTISVTLCPDSAFTLKGTRLYPPTTYIDRNVTQSGCDSVIVYIVNSGYGNIEEKTVTVCENEYFTWIHPKSPSGEILTKPGTYDDTISVGIGSGCTKIQRLNLKFKKIKDTIISLTICPTDSIFFKHGYVQAKGTYFDTIKTGLQRCDSFVQLRIYHHPQYFFPNETTICDNDYYILNNRKVYQDSTYIDSLYTIHGCDSIYKLRLHLSKTDTVYIDTTICEGQLYYLGDTILKTTGYYSYSTKNFKNPHCDSLTFVNLNVLPHTVRDTDVYLCYGRDTFTLHDPLLGDTTFLQDGTFLRHYQSASFNGCDSTLRVHVHVYPSYYKKKTVTICDNEYYTLFNGQHVNETKVYFDTFHTSPYGCDSIEEINLIVNRTYNDTVRIQLCNGMSFSIRNGVTFTNTGKYNDSLLTVNGCDSVITYLITKGSSFRISANYYSCSKNIEGLDYDFDWRRATSYNINHITKVTSRLGHYYDTLPSSIYGTCDTILDLFFVPIPEYYVELDTTICPSPKSDDETRFFWNGVPIKHSSDPADYRVTFNTSKIVTPEYTIPGICDSVVVLHVHHFDTFHNEIYAEICEGESYPFHKDGEWSGYTLPGTYKDTSTTTHGCDSITILHLTVHPAYNETIHYHLCENETIWLHDTIMCVGRGQHHDYYNSIHGCDSIKTYMWTTYANYIFQNDTDICANAPCTWRGKTITTPGVYYDSLYTQSPLHKCDSVYKLTVRHKEVKYNRRVVHICDNEEFDLLNNRQKMVKEQGLYIDTVPGVNGCDSIIETNLFVRQHFFREQDVYLCENDSFWVGEPYDVNSRCVFARDVLLGGDSSRDFYDSAFTEIGLCDSIHLYHIHLKSIYIDTIELRLCPNESYVIRDNIVLHAPAIQQSYYYPDTLISMNFCDSINVYKVVALESNMHTEYRKFCSLYDTIDFYWEVNGKSFHITEPGLYVEQMKKKTNGCDSIERLSVRYYDIGVHHIYDTICPPPDGEYYFGGKYVDSIGIYRDTIANLDEVQSFDTCAIINILHLAHYPTYKDTLYDTTCDNRPYIIGKHIIPIPIKGTKDSMYVLHDRTIHNCDSTTYLFLNYKQSYSDTINYSICPNQSITIRGRTLTFDPPDQRAPHPYIYKDTMNSHFGCDSVVSYIITVHPDYKFLRKVIACVGETILWTDIYGHERYITEPGVYADTFRTIHGQCDSIVGIHFIHAPTYDVHVYDTVWCTNDDYVWRNNKRFSESTVYTDTLRSIQGCDSIVTLHLTVYRPYLMRTRDSICENEKYWFRGHYYDSSGIYYDSTKTWAGCDSVFMLELRVVHVDRDTFYDTICIGESKIWGGVARTSNGVFYDTVKTPGELYCHVNVLYLRFLTERDSRLKFDSIADICADALSYDIYSRVQGYTPKQYCILYDEKGHDQGFNDIMYMDYNRHINVIMPKRFSNSYIYPDWYTLTFKAIYDRCKPDVDEYKLRFRVLYPSWIIEQNWGDVVALLNAEHNGGFTFDNYIWYVNDRVVSNMTSSNLYMKELGIGDQVYLVPTRQGEDYAIPTCPITIKQFIKNEEYKNPILVYPTSVTHINAKVNLESKIGGHYTIFDMYGHRLVVDDFPAGKLKSILMPDIIGCYLLLIETSDGRKQANKIMVY